VSWNCAAGKQRPLVTSNRNRAGGNHASTIPTWAFDVWRVLHYEWY
jgi:hypothetical protein